jgi:hypothetical protein
VWLTPAVPGRMLKNAIGGNSYTVMFGAIGPSSYNTAEIKNTLECARTQRIGAYHVTLTAWSQLLQPRVDHCVSLCGPGPEIRHRRAVWCARCCEVCSGRLTCRPDLQQENRMLAEERDRLTKQLELLRQQQGAARAPPDRRAACLTRACSVARGAGRAGPHPWRAGHEGGRGMPPCCAPCDVC